MFHARLAPVLFGIILSGLMSLLVSAISTLHAVGASVDFLRLWIGAWLTAWLFAFPVVLLVAPVTRRLVNNLVGSPAGSQQ
jgi:hypothetical protein